MEEKKRRSGTRIPSVQQIWNDLRAMKNKLDSLSTAVSKLKEMLNTTDNWHKRISHMIGKAIKFELGDGAFELGNGAIGRGNLLYSDRYTIGIEVGGQERMYNKGKIVYIALAE